VLQDQPERLVISQLFSLPFDYVPNFVPSAVRQITL